MALNDEWGLPLVDGLALPLPVRALLKPGLTVRNRDGEAHVLPRFFYQVESQPAALAIKLTPDFALWEFMDVDLHEAMPLRGFPRYVPCGVTALASALQAFRTAIAAPIRIAANGGYRSPSHARSSEGSAHNWATAANIYRIGSDWLDSADRIERYAAIARRVLPFAWVRPFGHDAGLADDHLHIDVGYITAVPRGASED